MLIARFGIDALRVSAILGLALCAMPLLRRASASTRRFVIALSLGAALVVPALSAFAPPFQVDTPNVVQSLRGIIVDEPRVDAESLAPIAPASVPSPQIKAEIAHPIDFAKWIVAAWTLGALRVLARLVVGLVRTRRLVRESTHAATWSIAIARAERAIGLRARVRVTALLDAPAVTGVFAPVVLVPRASESWSEERKYAVLLHELAHVRQQDCLVHAIAQLACAVHWFNPLCWLALRHLRTERELAADDAVIAAGARASSYAEDLLAIAGATALHRPVPDGALGMAERSPLIARIQAIVSVDRKRLPPNPLSTSVIVFGFGAVVFVVACAKPNGVSAVSPANTNSGVVPSSIATGAVSSNDAASSIDPRMQAIADDELDHVVAELHPLTSAILVLDPKTGEILANAGRDHDKHADIAFRRAYITGSTIKAMTLTAALDQGVLVPNERIDCEQGAYTYQGKVMHDANPNGVLSVGDMVAVSTNVGFTKIYDRIGGTRLTRYMRAFHFGEAPSIEGATAGTMPLAIPERTYDGAVAAIGEGIAASPLQVAAAYGAIANGGVYVPPTARRRTGEAPHETIMKPETARIVTEMLENVVSGERGTGKLARVAGVRVAGKTGTAGWELPNGKEAVYASFVGFAPAASPQFVIIVGIDEPQSGDEANGAKNAAPVFAKVASRILGGS